MPSIKSSIISVYWMQNVRSRKFWVPVYDTIKLRPCPFPPLKDQLFNEVIRISKSKGLDIGLVDSTQVGVDWLLNILSTLDENHEYFGKSFVPVKPHSKTKMVE